MKEPKPSVDPRLQKRALAYARGVANDPEVRELREDFLQRWRGKPRDEILKMIDQYKKNVLQEQEEGDVEGELDYDLWRIAALESLL